MKVTGVRRMIVIVGLRSRRVVVRASSLWRIGRLTNHVLMLTPIFMMRTRPSGRLFGRYEMMMNECGGWIVFF